MVINYGEGGGGATKRKRGGANEVLPLHKKGGAEKVLAMLKGGAINFHPLKGGGGGV